MQMGAHARRLRTLTALPGNPTVVVNCHPAKNAVGRQSAATRWRCLHRRDATAT